MINRHTTGWAQVSTLVFFLTCSLFLCACGSDMRGLQFFTPFVAADHRYLDWIELGITPGSQQGYTPQGIEWIRGKLILSESQKDRQNIIYQLSVKDKSYDIEAKFTMPVEATHTSGLAWDGVYLWAIDYKSQKLYKIDLEKSLVHGVAFVISQYPTGMVGGGSVAVFNQGELQVLAITDFMNTGATYIVPIRNLSVSANAKLASTSSYRNGFFNQGIKYSRCLLWESNNNIGADSIYAINLPQAVEKSDYRKATVASFSAPGSMIEDVAFGDGYVFTADESSFKLYKADLASLRLGCPLIPSK